jgi:hypothetical protein
MTERLRAITVVALTLCVAAWTAATLNPAPPDKR